jgi:hypothetical protein
MRKSIGYHRSWQMNRQPPFVPLEGAVPEIGNESGRWGMGGQVRALWKTFHIHHYANYGPEH